MFARPPSKIPIRAGAILAMVLACILVAGLLGLALIETVLVNHRQMHVVGRQQQSFWLAEAGIQRAVRQLAGSPDYQGEKWEIAADVLNSPHAALVTIEVGKPAASTEMREVRVEVRFPENPLPGAAYRRELVVAAPSESSPSPSDSKPEPKNADSEPNLQNDSQQQ